MATYLVEGIVLKYFPYRDYDRIFTLYTKEHGKIDAIGRGTGKILSKLVGHLQPVTMSRCMLAEGRRWDVLTQAKALHTYPVLHQNIEALALAGVAIEAVDRLTKTGQEEPLVYLALDELFKKLNSKHHQHGTLIYHFLWQLMTTLGFAPLVQNCISCKKSLEDTVNETPYFHFQEGGFVCSSCAVEGNFVWPVTPSALHKLNQYGKESLAVSKSHGTLSSEERGLARLILHFYQHVIGEDALPKNLLFYRSIYLSHQPSVQEKSAEKV